MSGQSGKHLPLARLGGIDTWGQKLTGLGIPGLVGIFAEMEKSRRVEWQQALKKGAGYLDGSQMVSPLGKEPKLRQLRVLWIVMLQLACESESEVTQPCPTLCDPMDCSPPGSSVHGIFQARVLEWVAISFSRGSSRPRDRTRVSHIVGRCFYCLSFTIPCLLWIMAPWLVLSQRHSKYKCFAARDIS